MNLWVIYITHLINLHLLTHYKLACYNITATNRVRKGDLCKICLMIPPYLNDF